MCRTKGYHRSIRGETIIINGVRLMSEDRQQSLIELMSETNSTPFQRDNSKPIPEEIDTEKKLARLKEDALSCTRCALRKGCRQVVFGEGNPNAHLMMVGEGPGSDEDRLGMPFVGRAGQLLDRILEAAQIKRQEIYITNVVKCRPTGNRLPLQPEVDSCLCFLQEQIKIINPEIVICLGALATRTLIDKDASITRSRGNWYKFGTRLYMATFHPAALLRDPGKKKYVWEDFKQIVKVCNSDDNGGQGQ